MFKLNVTKKLNVEGCIDQPKCKENKDAIFGESTFQKKKGKPLSFRPTNQAEGIIPIEK